MVLRNRNTFEKAIKLCGSRLQPVHSTRVKHILTRVGHILSAIVALLRPILFIAEIYYFSTTKCVWGLGGHYNDLI